MARKYEITFRLTSGEDVKIIGVGNTMTSATRSARRKLKPDQRPDFVVSRRFVRGS